MARKKEPEKPANHERWLVSFADFMTLLFALFVVLFANSQTDQEKMKAVSNSVAEAMSSLGFYQKSSTSDVTVTNDVFNPAKGTDINPVPLDGRPKTGVTQSPWDESGNPSEKISKPTFETKTGPKEGMQDPHSLVPPKPTPSPSPQPALPKPEELTGIGAPDSPEVKKILEELDKQLADEIKTGQLEVREERRGVVITLGEKGFFNSGSDTLKEESKIALSAIGKKLKSIVSARNITVRIEGHTDSRPLRSNALLNKFQDNLSLSSARANSVVRSLKQDYQFPARNLIASGYGEYRPVDTNETEAGRARNRRVDIVLLNDVYAKTEP